MMPPQLLAVAPRLFDPGTLHETYDLMEHCIGRGHFSEVKMALSREGRQRVAVKVLPKVDMARTGRILNEIAILRHVEMYWFAEPDELEPKGGPNPQLRPLWFHGSPATQRGPAR